MRSTSGVPVGPSPTSSPETRSIAADILANLDPAALTEQSAVDTLGPQINRWTLVHTIDELSQHIGHMELTIQLWNARA